MKASDHKPRCGEIWWVRFDPSVGREYREMRPALVVQAANMNTSPLTTVVPLTTQVGKGELCDIVIRRDSFNRLRKDSLAKMQYIQSFDHSRFDFLIGRVQDDVMRAVRASIRVHFGIMD